MLSANTYLKQTTEACVFRRVYVVRNVVKGQCRQTVSNLRELLVDGCLAYKFLLQTSMMQISYKNIQALCFFAYNASFSILN